MMDRAYHILDEYDAPPPASVSSSYSSRVYLSMPSATTDVAPCLIPEKCMTSAKKNASRDKTELKLLGCDATASYAGYFRCVCAKAQSLGNNEYFSAHCLLEECTDDRRKRGELHASKTTLKVDGKLRSTKAFMKQYQDGCKQLGASLAGIPEEWAPFATPLASTATKITPTAPQSSIEGAATNVSASLPSAHVTAIPLPPISPPISPPKHVSSTAIIAGSTVSAAVVLAILISLLKLYWKTKKKAKKLQVANAQLQDATNPDGVSQRISALMSSVSAQPGTSGHGGAEASAYADKEMCNRGRDAGAKSGTVGFPYTRDDSAGYVFDKRGSYTSRSADYAGGEGGYSVQQGLSDETVDVRGGWRISEYSESDYGSTRRRSWEELLASGVQEVRPLRVEKKG